MADRHINPNRLMDYNRSQYGQDRMRTQNTSSSYDKQIHDSHRSRPDEYAEPESFEEEETFLNDYRRHRGLMNPDDHSDEKYVGPSRDYDFKENSDFGPHYSLRKHEGPLQSMTDSVKNFFGKGPKNYKRSDERIYEEVCEALFHHPAIDASDIEVQVKNAVVTLKGIVETRGHKRLAEDIVDDCKGVHDIHNQLQVQNLSERTFRPRT